MTDLLDQFWKSQPTLVRPEPVVCDNMGKSLTHTWKHTVYQASDYQLPTCSCSRTVSFVAVPQSRDVFEFTVPDGAYRVLHLLGWDYAADTDGITVQRLFRGIFSKCGDDVGRYNWPRSCPFTIFPPGAYRIILYPVPVTVASDVASGGEFDVTVILEPVGQQFIDAVTAIGA